MHNKKLLAQPLQRIHTRLRLTSFQNFSVIQNQQTKRTHHDSKENQALVVKNICLHYFGFRHGLNKASIGKQLQPSIVYKI